MTYADKLKDPRWQKRRLELFEAAGWRCEECKSKTKTLHAHHGYYKRNTEPWEYPDEVMHVLCDACHKEMQAALERVHKRIGGFSFPTLMALDAMLCGLEGAGKSKRDVLLLLASIVAEAGCTDCWPKPTPAHISDGLLDYPWATTMALHAAMDASAVRVQFSEDRRALGGAV